MNGRAHREINKSREAVAGDGGGSVAEGEDLPVHAHSHKAL